jgi:hypothetical protein
MIRSILLGIAAVWFLLSAIVCLVALKEFYPLACFAVCVTAFGAFFGFLCDRAFGAR